MSNIKPFFSMAYCSKNFCWRSRQFGTSAKLSARQFGTNLMVSCDSRLAYPRPRPRLSSFKTKTNTLMSKTKTETQGLQN